MAATIGVSFSSLFLFSAFCLIYCWQRCWQRCCQITCLARGCQRWWLITWLARGWKRCCLIKRMNLFMYVCIMHVNTYVRMYVSTCSVALILYPTFELAPVNRLISLCGAEILRILVNCNTLQLGQHSWCSFGLVQAKRWYTDKH